MACSLIEKLRKTVVLPSVATIMNDHELGLKTKEIYSLTVWEARSPNCLCKSWQGHAPSEDSRRASFVASSNLWWLQLFIGLWQHHTNLCLPLHMALLNEFLCLKSPLAFLLDGHLSLELNQDDLILRALITSAKTFSEDKFKFTGSGGEDLNISFGGATILYYHPTTIIHKSRRLCT